MKAVKANGAGGPEVLSIVDTEKPEPKHDEIRIQVKAAGINRPDVFQRMGMYPPPPGVTDILGLEVSGIIDKVGASISDWSVGDEVCALVPGGGYANYVTTPPDTVLKKPQNLSFEEAAGIPETFFTVWTNVFDRGNLQKGETILIQGGSSGIGTTAIQMAKAFGSHVITTVGSEEKAALCRDLGADLVINYKEQSFKDVITEHWKKGVDVILDMVAGDYTQDHLSLLNPAGRLVLIAFLKGPHADINMLPVLTKNLTITGSTLRPKPLAYKKDIRDKIQKNIMPLLEEGTIKPVIDSCFSLDKVSEAHALMDSSNHKGKIILTL